MPSAIQSVGFIGLGNIGRPMAEKLLGQPFSVQVYDVASAATALLVESGAAAADDIVSMAATCDYLALCVRDADDIESLLYGTRRDSEGSGDGLLHHAQRGATLVIHSTVPQASVPKWANDAAGYGLDLVDAPMTGGAQGAEAGRLCYMVGGSAATVARITPILETSAEKIIHAGDTGAGIALKLCNNLITYAEFTAMSEATRLATACGLDPDVLREGGRSNGIINEQMHSFVSNRDALLANGNEEAIDTFFGAMGRLGKKDLDCVLATAATKKLTMTATEHVRELIEAVFLGKA